MGAHGGASRASVEAFAPGRVNLIGDHTDYTGGLAMPMAIDFGTGISFRRDPDLSRVELRSSLEDEPAAVPLSVTSVEAASLRPDWARYVAGVVAEVAPRWGGRGGVTSSLPRGAGLSSSASFEIALALALGAAPTLDTALACQRAEHAATGVPTGPLDQIAVTVAREGHAVMLDCGTLCYEHVAVPDDAEIVVCHSGHARSLAESAYARRRRECEMAEALIGPLSRATLLDVAAIADPLLRRRARHVVTENRRVCDFADALSSAALDEAGKLMSESHESLAGDFEVTVPALDDLVSFLQSRRVVLGARMTGAGFGGCAVALCRRGLLEVGLLPSRQWVVRPAAGAALRRAA